MEEQTIIGGVSFTGCPFETKQDFENFVLAKQLYCNVDKVWAKIEKYKVSKPIEKVKKKVAKK